MKAPGDAGLESASPGHTSNAVGAELSEMLDETRAIDRFLDGNDSTRANPFARGSGREAEDGESIARAIEKQRGGLEDTLM